MDSIKNLLSGSLQRHQITAQVTTARILEVANEALADILPQNRTSDAGAVFMREGVIQVHCRNAGAADLIGSRQNEILDAIKKKLPTARVDRIRTRIGV